MTSATAKISEDLEGRSMDPPSGKSLHARWAWFAMASIGALFVLLHWTFIERMFRIATDAQGSGLLAALKDAATSAWSHDWSHMVAIPFISLFYVYQNRQQILAEPTRVCWPGLVAMLFGIASFMFWIYPGRNDMFQGWSMILSLTGLVIFLLGPSVMKVLWFPIAYLVFAVKLPGSIFEAIAATLQRIAAYCSAILLQMIGGIFNFDAERSASMIELSFMRNGVPITEAINVAEACSGLRMLMAFIALGVAIAFFSNRPMWQRLVIVVLSVPIAIAVNVGRVTVIGLLYLVDKRMAQGDFHTMVGLLMLIPAGLLFLAIGWVLDRIVVYEEPQMDGDEIDFYEEPTVHPSWLGKGGGARPGIGFWSPLLGLMTRGIATGGALMLFLGLLFASTVAYRSNAFEWLPQSAALGGILAALVLIPATIYLLRCWGRRAGEARTFAASVVGGVLLVAVMGFTSVIKANELVLFKQAVPMREQFYLLPLNVNGWTRIGKDVVLTPEIEQALKTKWYLGRLYRREVLLAGDRLVDRLAAEGKPATVYLHLAYYTGTADTVPHVPDRCMVEQGAGFVQRDRDRWVELSGPQYEFGPKGSWAHPRMVLGGVDQVRVPQTDFNVTCFTFRQNQQRAGIASTKDVLAKQGNVVYFFVANGKCLASPNEVRLANLNLRDRHAYYCKVEVQMSISDPDEAVEVASEFLSDMMPEILRCLPDWTEVTEGHWPPTEVDS